MKKYIELEAAITGILACERVPGTDQQIRVIDAYDAVRTLPAAPVREVVRGRWELDTFETTATCSVCWCCIPIEWKDDDIRWDFCPNCGADMRTEEGGQT